MKCTFFGHRTTSSDVHAVLKKVLIDLIENDTADDFYVGNNGAFDRVVKRTLQELQMQYPHIRYTVVLSYLPVEKKETEEHYTNTLYPDCLHGIPPRYAILKRNRWMVKQADTVITYVQHPFGGAAKFKEMAQKEHKTIIELSTV